MWKYKEAGITSRLFSILFVFARNSVSVGVIGNEDNNDINSGVSVLWHND
jgi:hypothetical protein